MRILIVRHADPDYEIDSLTPKGWKEAELLSKRLIKYDLNGIYCSPLGRACDTAGVTLKKLNREAEICDWLREFDVPVRLPNGEMKGNCWDLMPSYWTGIEAFYGKDSWLETDLMKSGPAKEHYRQVSDGMDEILSRFGYLREGNIYRTSKGNCDTIVLFLPFWRCLRYFISPSRDFPGSVMARICCGAKLGNDPFYRGTRKGNCKFSLSVVWRYLAPLCRR